MRINLCRIQKSGTRTVISALTEIDYKAKNLTWWCALNRRCRQLVEGVDPLRNFHKIHV
ncbi:hypothetical protein SLEP1_g12631 [Rubroshorea leprosula]|uniref:Uncharacterized protein n=1 Tax=Rubroshorea leprosula TaxID=152421 RepID=A0AAV5IJ65_9ROSI|nr:hypothetical protein SLEP1_g12631 [Rubroshorea leprosula]